VATTGDRSTPRTGPARAPRTIGPVRSLPSGPSSAGPRGFSLVETLVALALVAVALLVTVGLFTQAARAERRLAAHRQAQATVETVLELVRAGAIPLAPLEWGWDELEGAPLLDPPVRARLQVEVEGTEVPDLYRVAVLLRYPVRGFLQERRLESLVWRPP
jgi:prepilin-type N-terminal cleavage/methylation domain-containing protein